VMPDAIVEREARFLGRPCHMLAAEVIHVLDHVVTLVVYEHDTGQELLGRSIRWVVYVDDAQNSSGIVGHSAVADTGRVA